MYVWANIAGATRSAFSDIYYRSYACCLSIDRSIARTPCSVHSMRNVIQYVVYIMHIVHIICILCIHGVMVLYIVR